MTIKDLINLTLIAAVLAFVVYKDWSNTKAIHQHEVFFEELCEKINEVAFDATERDLIDCEKYEDRPM